MKASCCIAIMAVGASMWAACVGRMLADEDRASQPAAETRSPGGSVANAPALRRVLELGDHRFHTPSEIPAVVFSPDGHMLATSSERRSVFLFEQESRAPTSALSQPGFRINAMGGRGGTAASVVRRAGNG